MSRIAVSLRNLRNKEKRGQSRPKGTKSSRKVIPLLERERIVQMSMMGKKQREISRDTGHARKSIARIISDANIPAYVETVRGQFVDLGTAAVKAIKKKIEEGDVDLAKWFLTNSGIVADVKAGMLAANAAGVGNPSQVVLSARNLAT